MKTKTLGEFTVPEDFDKSVVSFHTREQSKDKLSNRSNKPLITQSKLFLEVASVIGKVGALEELTKAYRSYNGKDCFRWDEGLWRSFTWIHSVQGHYFWLNIYCKIIAKETL